MKKRLLLLIAPIVALILECLPYGIIMYYAVNDGMGRAAFTFSYFDPVVPFGGANFGAPLTAISTCVIIILSLIYVFTAKQGLKTAILVVAFLGIVFSVLPPMVFGFDTVSVINVIVTVCMMAEAILALQPKKGLV
ncbi:MAG: hypothetical protein J1F60_07595 [Oscillospiraceae bacterium]|nr:hypothetical protein [Oscillospiraceae bacterium]